MNKAFFFDIDGTLLANGKNEVSPKTIYALKELKKNGNLIYICTGKSINDAIDVSIQMDVFDLITSNGQVISYEKEIKYCEYFPFEICQEINKICRKKKKIIGIQTNFSNYIFNPFETAEECFENEIYIEITDFLRKVNIKTPSLINSISANMEITQCWIINETVDLFSNVPVNTLPWTESGCDLILENANKVNAVKKILQECECSKSYAFGDGANDVEMLKFVDIGVAMGNASSSVKSIADDVTECVDQDGIYNYLIKNNLIKEMS